MEQINTHYRKTWFLSFKIQVSCKLSIHPILGHKLAAVAGRSMGMLGTQQLHLLDIRWHQGSCCVSNSCRRLLFFVASLLQFERFPSFCLWHTLTCRAVFTTGALDNAGQLTAATFSTYHRIHRQRANPDWAFREETTRKKSIKKSWMTPRSCTVISAWCSSLLSKLGSAMHSSVPVNINFLDSMAASSRFHPEIWSETKQIVVRCSMVRCPCMSLQLVDWKDATMYGKGPKEQWIETKGSVIVLQKRTSKQSPNKWLVV